VHEHSRVAAWRTAPCAFPHLLPCGNCRTSGAIGKRIDRQVLSHMCCHMAQNVRQSRDDLLIQTHPASTTIDAFGL
jgi:hypothetical protein